ncbi:MAG: hypothetical protein IKQ96_07055 [Lachnospiraceae bacterium]|nr:hypothetical protein [Lachnospiraceae bacterium]
MTIEQAMMFYEGDATGDDPFWGDRKAYVTINSLLFPGLRNERARAAEGKRLNPAFLEDIDRLESFYLAMFQGLKKNAVQNDVVTSRVERLQDYEEQKKAGYLFSFTSTSTAGFLTEYGDKKGLALLTFTIPAGTPSVCFADALSHYEKAEEKEILLSPFLKFSVEEQKMDDRFMSILDADGNPPAVYAKATVSFSKGFFKKATETNIEALAYPAGGAEAGKRIYQAFNNGQEPAPEDEVLFTAFKQVLQGRVIRMAADIF